MPVSPLYEVEPDLSDQKGKKKSRTMEESLKFAKQHMRNNALDDLEEPEALASGDMDKFIENLDGLVG